MWGLIFVLVALAVSLIMSLVEENRRESTQQRLERLVRQRKSVEGFVSSNLPGPPLDPEEGEGGEKRKGASVRAREALVGIVERATVGRRFSNTLEVRLLRADWRLKPAEFLVAQAISAGVGLALGFTFAPTLLWLSTIFGWLLPHLLLTRGEKKRLKQFEQQLPDALAIIANALRSGYSFLQAMDTVSREMPDPVGKEFSLVLRETRVNIPLDDGLSHLVDRVKSQDLDLVVTAVLIQRQVGGNLSEVLEKIGDTIKDRIRLQGEIRTLTTQGRFSGWIVSLLPAVIAILFQVISPGFLAPMFHHPIGWVLIGVGVVMQSIGILLIRNMVNLEV